MAIDWNRSAICILSLAFAGQVGIARAQAITPGGVQDTLKKIPEPSSKTPLADTIFKSSAPAAVVPLASTRSIHVARFEIVGNTVYSSAELLALLEPYTRRTISLEELYRAADQLTDFYVRQGYTLASAVIPAQKISNETVRIEVIEGRIGKLSYEGLRRYRATDLQPYFSQSEGSVYRAKTFEQSLFSVDTLPGLNVRARLQPGAEYGTSDILILASEKLLQGSIFIDNGGTQNIGIIRMGGELAVNNPLGLADQLSLSAMRSREGLLKYGAASYSLPTGMDASRLNLSYGRADFKVSGAFKGVRGNSRTARGELFMPLLVTSTRQASTSLAVSNVQANADFSGVTFNQSKVTLLEISGNFSRTHDNRAVTQGSLTLASNFKSAGDDLSTNNVPLRADLNLQELTPLPYLFQLLTRVQLVYGLDPLPDTQKLSIGGPATVRSYSPSEARGDWGYLAQLTLRRNFIVGGALLTPRVFYDLGEVRQHQTDRFPPGTAPQDVSLAGYGFGMDAGYRKLSIKLDYAIPTTKAPVSDGKEDGRLYGTFSLVF